jgi:hypothetical protein
MILAFRGQIAADVLERIGDAQHAADRRRDARR